MRRPARPLFLERRGYRQRRVRDAARMLPLLGLALWALPLLFSADGSPARTSQVLIYMFVVWLGLAAAAAALSLGLDTKPGPADDSEWPPNDDADALIPPTKGPATGPAQAASRPVRTGDAG